MSKVPCWAWQQCSVHLNSPVMKNCFVLFPLWGRWACLICLSRQHWLVCIKWASEAEWKTGANARSRRGCSSHSIRLSKPTACWSPRSCLGGRCEKMNSQKLRGELWSMSSTWWTWPQHAGRERKVAVLGISKKAFSDGRVRIGGNLIISLCLKGPVWLRTLTVLLLLRSILDFAPKYLNLNF